MKRTILIVEDEPAIREMVRLFLERAEFSITEVHNAQQAIYQLAESRPHLIILDWMLPDMPGIELLHRLKKDNQYQDIPIIMLTAREAEEDKVRGLNAGADDYITKPFSPKELMARIHAVLRRLDVKGSGESLIFDELELNEDQRRVTIQGRPLAFGPTEFRLLHFFLTHQGKVYTRTQLLDRVWGSNVYVEDRTVDVHIRRLRKALSLFGYDRYVKTVRSVGYCFSKE